MTVCTRGRVGAGLARSREAELFLMPVDVAKAGHVTSTVLGALLSER